LLISFILDTTATPQFPEKQTTHKLPTPPTLLRQRERERDTHTHTHGATTNTTATTPTKTNLKTDGCNKQTSKTQMRTRVKTTTTTSTRPESRTTELLLQAQHTSLQSSNALMPGNKKHTHTHAQWEGGGEGARTHKHTQNFRNSCDNQTRERDPTKNKKNNLNKEKLADKCSI
jgi:hypothetical protein